MNTLHRNTIRRFVPYDEAGNLISDRSEEIAEIRWNAAGKVTAVISNAPGGGTQPTLETLTDYYPFGMAMPGRSYNAYRYGFNSQENVPELGEGHTTALYWEYDGRLGRRWNVDVVEKAYESNLKFYRVENVTSTPDINP